jgi:cyclase
MNILRIFNDKETDELVILDIDAHRTGNGPDLEYIQQVAAECFMPVTYGGGITRVEDADALFAAGVDKICLNSTAFTQPKLIATIANKYGSQAIVVSIDVRKNLFRQNVAVIHGGIRKVKIKLSDFVRHSQDHGCGEILINSVDRDGTQTGYDLDLIANVVQQTNVPVVACGGAANNSDLHSVITKAGAAAAAAGSMFVFQGPHRAVLISYPKRDKMETLFNAHNPAIA